METFLIPMRIIAYDINDNTRVHIQFVRVG